MVRFEEDSSQIPVIPLHHVTPEVFACIVQHVYGETVAQQVGGTLFWCSVFFGRTFGISFAGVILILIFAYCLTDKNWD